MHLRLGISPPNRCKITQIIRKSGRKRLKKIKNSEKYGWTIYIPKFSYTTDNAAMIGITGYYKYLDNDFCSIDKPAFSKTILK